MNWAVGNGKSRLAVDLSLLDATNTWGCNGIYRDYQLGNIIALDYPMLLEIAKSEYKANIYTRESNVKRLNVQEVKAVDTLPWISTMRSLSSEHMSSGSYALYMAAARAKNKVGILGFDFFSYDGPNNVYLGTTNYEIYASNRIDPTYWLEQFNKILEAFPSLEFLYFAERHKDELTQLFKKPNFNWQSIEEAHGYF